MMTKTHAAASNTKDSRGWYKRLFAWMMCKMNSDASTIKLNHCSCASNLAELKKSLFANIHGEVLEIGAGTGPNLSYYPPEIHLIGVEPNQFMHSYLQQEAERLGLNVDIYCETAENLDIKDNSMDVVVSTLVLCSVDDLAAVLQEVLRVLKPGGRFLFLEHVAAPKETQLRRMQHWIRPIWRAIGDGCCPERETWVLIEEAGFESVSYEHFRVPGIPITSSCIVGMAIK